MSPEVGVDVTLHSSSYPILGPVPGSCTAEIAKVFVDHGVGLTCVGGRIQFEELRRKITEHIGEVGVVLGHGVVVGFDRTGLVLVVASQDCDILAGVHAKRLAILVCIRLPPGLV